MTYRDRLYGEWSVPEYLVQLMQTKEMVRLRGITQSVLPNDLLIRGPIPSRFQHGMGVAFMAYVVNRKNPELSDEQKLLLQVASLIHDGGMSPFSDIGEHFLKEITGRGEEEFLGEVLDGSESEKILKELGLSVEAVVNFISGKNKPFGDIINGSMDIDNLDNVARYNWYCRCGGPCYRTMKVASSFRFVNNEWILLRCAYREAKKWQQARKKVYQFIYSYPHLAMSGMIYRAMELAFFESEIKRPFFFMTDQQALEFLGRECNKHARTLIERAMRWQWYWEVFSLDVETSQPSPRLVTYSSHWTGRSFSAEKIRQLLNVPPEDVCVVITKSKEKRKIALPFISEDGKRIYDTSDETPIYKIKVFMPEKYKRYGDKISDFIFSEIIFAGDSKTAG